jgi:hypothetical protein
VVIGDITPTTIIVAIGLVLVLVAFYMVWMDDNRRGRR